MTDFVKDSIALLREMVRVPSESFSEAAVADLVFGRLSEWGLAPELVGKNVIARNSNFNEELPTLVLDAHIDTVPPARGYTRDPFDPGEDTGVVYGLGSNDDGGSVAAITAVFRYFYNRELPFNLVLSLSAEEEKSGPGGAVMLYGPDGPSAVRDADWVIVGEPTGMKAATSERGLLVLDGTARGVSGHSARSEGVNALYIALDDILALRSHKFSKISSRMGSVRLNVTQIACGTAHNVIPDTCSFVVDIRPTDCYSNSEILEELQSVCTSTLVPRNLRNSSSATYDGSPLAKAVESIGLETFSSPTTSNWMRTGKDAIKLGPGDSSRSHRADEYILCSEIEEAVEKYILLIENFYGNSLE